MKRILLAAGVGLCILTVSMAAPSNNYGGSKTYNLASDTTPQKDTSKKRPDTMHISMLDLQGR